MATELDRREFLVTTALVGGGMALSLYLPDAEAAESADARVNARPWLPPSEGGVEVNPWIVIGPDDRVLIRVNQSELGQGVMTSNPMMICEELECDWSKVQSVYAEPNRHMREHALYDHLHTEASSSVRLGRALYQQAGASARERLKTAAAQEWSVPVTEIETKNGVLTHKPTSRTLRYGQVAAKAAAIKLDKEPAIKTPDQYTLIGSRVRRFDVEVKSRAEAVYGIDIRVPGMVYAATKQSPSYGGSLKSYNFNAIRNLPGVIAAVPMEGIGHYSGIAVVADSWWRAKTALDKMPVTWNPGPNANRGSADLFQQYRAMLDRQGPTPVDEGDVEKALQGATKIVEAEYQLSHQAHAQLEPPNCTAHITGDKAEIWFGTQSPDYATAIAAKLSGLPAANVFVHNCFEGGGFGMGGTHGELQQAVVLAKALQGRPVKVQWTREEDIAHVNGFHPMGVAKMTAALGPDGMPTAIWVKLAGNDALEGTPLIEYGPHKAKLAHQLLRGFHLFPYGTPNLRVEVNTMKTWVPSATWRSTGTYANVFYLESFVEEMARAAGRDPIEYRRALIAARRPDSFEDNAKPDWLKALDTVAEKSGWGKALPPGTGIGFAIDDRKSVAPRGIALVAIGVTVSVSKAGAVTIERMDIVHDQGHAIINPEAADRQIRGMMAWSLGPVFNQEITFRNGAVEQSNYHDYAPIRMAEFPKNIDIHYIKTNRWISGIGEEVVPLVAPAVLNAIHAATGKRIRSLPLRKHDLSWA
ncbi:MAG TPA: molybdopterin cofactor-binding domain-containing protein [Micropepsaceae bacterium]|nr:molybdopterin cofactor-binding domain-containing protein [Micropepsaceae bacterium]